MRISVFFFFLKLNNNATECITVMLTVYIYKKKKLLYILFVYIIIMIKKNITFPIGIIDFAIKSAPMCKDRQLCEILKLKL